jgi:two-component system, NarL family, sensor histidine kinase DevS
LSGAEPATVFRRVAQEALKLTGADAAIVAIPVEDPVATGDVAELLVAETVGQAVAAVTGKIIPLADTVIGAAYTEREPQRIKRFDFDGVDATGPHWYCRCGPLTPSQGSWWCCVTAGRSYSPRNNWT